MQLSDLIPPLLLRFARKHPSSKTYPSYDDAALACSASGYQQEALLGVIYEKTKRYRGCLRAQKPLEIDLANVRTVLGLCLGRKGDSFRVIDFGGACGAHYFLARSIFGDETQLLWYVVETKGMVSKGRALENDELKFFDDIGAAKARMGQVDLMFSSGALQYVPHPYETLQSLVDCKANSLFLTRLGLTTGERELVYVQESMLSSNGPGPMPAGMRDGRVKYPMTAVNKRRLEEILAEQYEIRMQFNEDKGAHWIMGRPIHLYGYWGELRDCGQAVPTAQ